MRAKAFGTNLGPNLTAVFLLIILAGCASRVEIERRNAIEDDAKCQSFGAKLGERCMRRAGRRWTRLAPRPGPNSGGGAGPGANTLLSPTPLRRIRGGSNSV